MRVKIILAYNGAAFDGSQVQSKTPNTVMGVLYAAFEALNIHTKIHMSGRTDAGVHATRQVMHCDLPDYWTDTDKLKRYLQNRLPHTVLIRRIIQIDESFHARYSARKRAYRYVLSHAPKNPFDANLVTYVNQAIEVERLKPCMQLLEGTHDFSGFMKSGSSNKTTVRTLYKARCYTHRNKTVFYFEANGFLRSQIRLIVAFLLEINTNKVSIEDLKAQLNGDKTVVKRPAPPNGLYLCNIIY